MSKLCVLAFLFYNIIITMSYSSEYDVDTYDDRADNGRFNLLELLNDFDKKARANRRYATESPDLENWTGRWMPDRPGDPTPPPKIWPAVKIMVDLINPSSMESSSNCDDGKTKLEVDWDNLSVNYTCYGRKIIPDRSIDPVLYNDYIPPTFTAWHVCMDGTIEYDSDIPLFGNHRPVWPVYGEYKFLPKQRWLHSLEHGAVVMLYHPCANSLEITRLKTLVKNCLRRHIISTYNLLEEVRPLALLTWGSRLAMSHVDKETVESFIREKSLRGPEAISSDGAFQEGLVNKSQIVSDIEDSNLCPNH